MASYVQMRTSLFCIFNRKRFKLSGARKGFMPRSNGLTQWRNGLNGDRSNTLLTEPVKPTTHDLCLICRGFPNCQSFKGILMREALTRGNSFLFQNASSQSHATHPPPKTHTREERTLPLAISVLFDYPTSAGYKVPTTALSPRLQQNLNKPLRVKSRHDRERKIRQQARLLAFSSLL